MAKIMKLTAVLTLIVTAVMAVLFYRFKADAFLTLAITFGTIAYHFWMRLAVGGLLNMTMKNHADYTKKWYQIRPFEKKL